jgi:hypothetical protein
MRIGVFCSTNHNAASLLLFSFVSTAPGAKDWADLKMFSDFQSIRIYDLYSCRQKNDLSFLES